MSDQLCILYSSRVLSRGIEFYQHGFTKRDCVDVFMCNIRIKLCNGIVLGLWPSSSEQSLPEYTCCGSTQASRTIGRAAEQSSHYVRHTEERCCTRTTGWYCENTFAHERLGVLY